MSEVSAPEGDHQENLEESPEAFGEALAEHFEDVYPQVVHSDIDEQEGLRSAVSKREAVINDRELEELLTAYGIEPSLVTLGEDGYYRMRFSKETLGIDLPEGYGLKGGAARALLVDSLGVLPAPKYRDVDLVRVVPDEPRRGLDKELAQKYMSEDARHGYGVEVVLDYKEYFNSRDLTINEVLVVDGKIITTRQCLLDTVRNIIRITDYERRRFGGTPGPKMFSKALRLYSESIWRWDEAALADVEDWEYEKNFIPPFWLALQLDRAYESGPEVAGVLVEEMIKRNQIPQVIDSVEAAARHLSDQMRDWPFYYRHAPVEQFALEDEYRDYERYPTHLGFGRG